MPLLKCCVFLPAAVCTPGTQKVFLAAHKFTKSGCKASVYSEPPGLLVSADCDIDTTPPPYGTYEVSASCPIDVPYQYGSGCVHSCEQRRSSLSLVNQLSTSGIDGQVRAMMHRISLARQFGCSHHHPILAGPVCCCRWRLQRHMHCVGHYSVLQACGWGKQQRQQSQPPQLVAVVPPLRAEARSAVNAVNLGTCCNTCGKLEHHLLRCHISLITSSSSASLMLAWWEEQQQKAAALMRAAMHHRPALVTAAVTGTVLPWTCSPTC